MGTIAEQLEASRTREQSLDTLVDALRSNTPVERLRFAVNVCAILDKGNLGEAYSLLVEVTAKEADPTLDLFRVLSKEDKLRVAVKALFLVEQDKAEKPRNTRRGNGNGAASTGATDLILKVVSNAKVPLTRAQIFARCQETMPDIPENTVQGVVSAKKADGTLRHDGETHTYTMA
jgi:hypothetical protein